MPVKIRYAISDGVFLFYNQSFFVIFVSFYGTYAYFFICYVGGYTQCCSIIHSFFTLKKLKFHVLSLFFCTHFIYFSVDPVILRCCLNNMTFVTFFIWQCHFNPWQSYGTMRQFSQSHESEGFPKVGGQELRSRFAHGSQNGLISR